MIINCTGRVAKAWKLELQDNTLYADQSDFWSLSFGYYNHKRYYFLVHEMTMMPILMEEANPGNLKDKIAESLLSWSELYGWKNLEESNYTKLSDISYCKNNNRVCTGRLSRLIQDTWYTFDTRYDSLRVQPLRLKEKGFHTWVYLGMESYPVKLFEDLLTGENKAL